MAEVWEEAEEWAWAAAEDFRQEQKAAMDKEYLKSRVEEALRRIVHPEINHTLFELGMIRDINAGEEKASLTLKVPMLDIPIKDYLMDLIKSEIKKVDSKLDVEVGIEEMSLEERAKFMRMAQEAWRG